jgi:hypothetical protein
VLRHPPGTKSKLIVISVKKMSFDFVCGGWRSTVIPCENQRMIPEERAYQRSIASKFNAVLHYFKNEKITSKSMPGGTRVFVRFTSYDDYEKYLMEPVKIGNVVIDFGDVGSYEDQINKLRIQVLGLPSDLQWKEYRNIILRHVPVLADEVDWEHYGVTTKIKQPNVKNLTVRNAEAVNFVLDIQISADEHSVLSFLPGQWKIPHLKDFTTPLFAQSFVSLYKLDKELQGTKNLANVLLKYNRSIVSYRLLKRNIDEYFLHLLYKDTKGSALSPTELVLGGVTGIQLSIARAAEVLNDVSTHVEYPANCFMKSLSQTKKSFIEKDNSSTANFGVESFFSSREPKTRARSASPNYFVDRKRKRSPSVHLEKSPSRMSVGEEGTGPYKPRSPKRRKIRTKEYLRTEIKAIKARIREFQARLDELEDL